MGALESAEEGGSKEGVLSYKVGPIPFAGRHMERQGGLGWIVVLGDFRAPALSWTLPLCLVGCQRPSAALDGWPRSDHRQ